MKEILITGASGFLGRSLAEQLKGCELLVPTHGEVDLDSLDQVDQYFMEHKPDLVINCATKGDRTDFDPASNDLRMFFNLVEQKVPMIHIGSGAEYGKDKPLRRVRELQFGMWVPEDVYGFSKFVMSRYIEATTEGNDFGWSEDFVCLRPFGIFGKYEDPNRRFISNAIGHALKGEPIVIYKDLTFDYLYVDDFVRIVDHFIQSSPPWRNAFYNLGGQTVTLSELARKINQLTGNKEVKVLDKRERGLEYTADNTRLLAEIDFKFISIDLALKEMVEWYRKGGEK